MVGAPGSSSRGRGGKFKKYTRGGGKHFSRDIRPLDADGNEVSIWAEDGKTKGEDDSDDSEEDSEEDSEDEAATAAQTQAASREDRKAEKKARKEAAIAKSRGKTVEVGDMPSSDEDESEDDDMPANPNHSKASRNQAKGTPVEDITEGVANMGAPSSRREREALEAVAAKEKYMRLQAQGKTDEAKADLARLQVIREQRAAEAARRQAEKEEREEVEKKKKADFEAREARKKEASASIKKGKKK